MLSVAQRPFPLCTMKAVGAVCKPMNLAKAHRTKMSGLLFQAFFMERKRVDGLMDAD